MLPLCIAVDLLQPSPPIESSLHLMLIPFVQIRHRSMDLAYHPGLGPLPDRSRSRDDYSGHLRHSCRSQERFLERFVPSDAPSHSRGPRSRGFPSPKHWNFHGSHIRNSRCDSHQGGHLRNTRCYSHQEGYPLQENGLCTMGVTLFKANEIRIKRVTLSKANRIRFSLLYSDGIRFKGVPFSQRLDLTSRGIPFPKRMWFIARGSPSPSEWDSHQEGHPFQSEWDSLLTPGLVAAETPFKGFFSKATLLKGFPFSKGLCLCA